MLDTAFALLRQPAVAALLAAVSAALAPAAVQTSVLNVTDPVGGSNLGSLGIGTNTVSGRQELFCFEIGGIDCVDVNQGPSFDVDLGAGLQLDSLSAAVTPEGNHQLQRASAYFFDASASPVLDVSKSLEVVPEIRAVSYAWSES